MKEGLFITFEGGDGSGKSTLLEGVASFLKKEGLPFIKTREPGGTVLSERIRDLLLHRNEVVIGMEAELLLFLASRTQNIEEVIRPALAEGKTVLCDRFHDSTIAYQGLARGMGMKRVKELCLKATDNFLPSVTFLLDLPAKEGLARSRRRGEAADAIEEEALEFHERVREGYLLQAESEPSRFVVIDARGSIESILEEAKAAMRLRLSNGPVER